MIDDQTVLRHRYPRIERLLPQVPERPAHLRRRRRRAERRPARQGAHPAGREGRRGLGVPPHGHVHRDEHRAGARRRQEDHRERGLLLDPPDPRGVRGHQGRPQGDRQALQARRLRAHPAVARAGRRAPRGQEPPDVHLPGQRRLVGGRRHDLLHEGHQALRQPRRRHRRSRDGLVLAQQPDAVGHAPRGIRRGPRRAPRRALQAASTTTKGRSSTSTCRRTATRSTSAPSSTRT